MQFVPLASGGVIGRGQPYVNSRNARTAVDVIRYDVSEGGLSETVLVDGTVSTSGAIGLDAQQRVLIARSGFEGSSWIQVCRVHGGEGTPDSTFGENGCVNVDDLPTGHADAIIGLPSGGMLVRMSGGWPTLVQLTSSGVRDSGFGTDGVLRIEQQATHIASIAVQSDGRILVSLEKWLGGSDFQPKLIRLMPSGAIDTSFGNGGELPDVGGDLHVGTDDTFIALSTESIFAYHADGTPDVTFGTGGSVNLKEATETTAEAFEIRAITRDASGRIYATAGFGTESSGFGGLLVRLTPTGALDPEFQVRTGEGTRVYWVGSALAIGADGKIWVMMCLVGANPMPTGLALLLP